MTREISLIKNDPVLQFLFGSQDDEIQWLRGAFLLYCPTVVVVFCSWMDNTILHLPTGDGLGLFEHFGLLSLLLFYPISILTFISATIRFNSFIRGANRYINHEVLRSYDIQNNASLSVTLQDIISHGHSQIKYSLLLRTALFFVGFCAVAVNIRNTVSPHFLEVYRHDVFDSTNHIYGFLATKTFFLIFWGFLTPIVIEKLIIIISTLNNLFVALQGSNSLVVNSLHPDNAGGLSELGWIALRLNYAAALSLVYLFALYMSHGLTYSLIIGTVCVIMLLCIVFFLPLRAAHRAMREMQRIMLMNLSQHNESINEELSKRIISARTAQDVFCKEGERFYSIHEKILNLYEGILGMPTWPYDYKTVLKFVGTIILPFFFFVLDLIKNYGTVFQQALGFVSK